VVGLNVNNEGKEMNAKTCKAIRREMKAQHYDVREAQYVTRNNGNTSLIRTCGRSVYRHEKNRVAKRQFLLRRAA